jgi:hypothetical protein
MSKIGNGFIFRIKRTNETVDVDSADAKFNETFSDCRDRKGRIIKGGKVLDPDLINELDKAADIEKAMESWGVQTISEIQTSRFSSTNRYDKLSDDDDDEGNDDDEDNDKKDSKKRENFSSGKFTTFFPPHDDENFSSGKFTTFSPFNDDGDPDDDDGEQSEPEKQKTKRHQIGPMKREIKNLLPSKGFQEATQKDQSKLIKKILPSNGSQKSKRVSKPPERLEPNFEATQKRRGSTLFLENEDDDLTDLDPTVRTFDQLLSCLEQGIGKESGKLDDPVEDQLKSQQNIGSDDPKSQKAIDKMPPEARKRYNDATTREYEGMKSKEVMEFVRMTDIPKHAKIYICIVNWTTKYVLGVYQKTKCRICFGGHHYVKTFTDCFAPTVNFCSVLIMLCLAAMFGWFIGSLDYAQAYLNADIDEECFLRAPEFLREYDSDGIELIWRLKKVIYGHPKGSRLWAECLHEKLKQLQFTQLATDQCVYAKWVNWDRSNLKDDSYFVFVLIHSDDLIILSNKKHMMLEEKSKLLKAFEGVDQGILKSFCGVEIDIQDSKISLTMNYYWKRLMQRFGIQDHEKEQRPLKTKVSKDDCPTTPNEARKLTYLQIIGSIIFGFTHCRLDLAFPVGMLTRVMHSPNEAHLKQLMDLLKYINATKDWGLNYFRDVSVYYGMAFIFFGFCDSSHADDPTTTRSTGGYFFFLRKGQGCICSKSGQTPDVALSSTEAETIWACMAATQGAFIKQFLDELKIFGETSFELMEDSQPAINAQRKNVSQSRFRHIKIKYHYIRQLISEGWCKLVKISTKAQVADMATKILPTATVKYFSNIVLGISVNQSLNAYDSSPFNDWGVVSEPSYLSS